MHHPQASHRLPCPAGHTKAAEGVGLRPAHLLSCCFPVLCSSRHALALRPSTGTLRCLLSGCPSLLLHLLLSSLLPLHRPISISRSDDDALGSSSVCDACFQCCLCDRLQLQGTKHRHTNNSLHAAHWQEQCGPDGVQRAVQKARQLRQQPLEPGLPERWRWLGVQLQAAALGQRWPHPQELHAELYDSADRSAIGRGSQRSAALELLRHGKGLAAGVL